MSVKNFDKKSLTITWNIEMVNYRDSDYRTDSVTYTKFYGDAMPIPSPTNPWTHNSVWYKVVTTPSEIPATVTESVQYTMRCEYTYYVVTWNVTECTPDWCGVDDIFYSVLPWSGTPVPSFPSVNPYDGEPWTIANVDTPDPTVTQDTTYYAYFEYTPATPIPTGFSNPTTVWGPWPVYNSWYTSEYYSYVNNLSTACGSSTSQSYIYNNDYIIQSRVNWSNYKFEIYLLEYDFSSGMGATLISSWCLDNEQSGPEYNFRYNSDASWIVSKFWSVDDYVAYLFNEGILSFPPTPPPAP